MTALLQAPEFPPPADTDGVMDIFRGFQEHMGGSAWIVLGLGVAGVALVAWLVVWRAIIEPRRNLRRDLEALFVDLARANGLGDAERQFLQAAARFHQLGNPSVVFARRSLVEAYWDQARGRTGMTPQAFEGMVQKLYSS